MREMTIVVIVRISEAEYDIIYHYVEVITNHLRKQICLKMVYVWFLILLLPSNKSHRGYLITTVLNSLRKHIIIHIIYGILH